MQIKHRNISIKNYKINNLSDYFCVMRLILLVLFLFHAANIWAQSKNTLTFTSAGREKLVFTLLSNPSIEVINGKLNLACQSKEGPMFQLNGIDAKRLKHSEVALKKAEVKWIHAQLNEVSTGLLNKSKTRINCKSCLKDDFITFIGEGHIFIKKKRYTFKFRLMGVIPPAQMIKTN
jgi:hypothetical protein